MKRFQFSIYKFKWDRVFLNYAFNDSDGLIILFEADGPVINNFEYICGK